MSNIKTTLAGTFHSQIYRKYAQQYLGGFAYRFNLHGLVASLIVTVARCSQAKKSIINAGAEACY